MTLEGVVLGMRSDSKNFKEYFDDVIALYCAHCSTINNENNFIILSQHLRSLVEAIPEDYVFP